MAAKPTRAPARRKSKPIQIAQNVVASIVFISPEYRKHRAHYEWQAVLKEYVNSLSDHETNVVRKCFSIINEKPEYIFNLPDPCPVITFPIQNVCHTQEAQ